MCIFVDFHVFMEDFLLLYQKKSCTFAISNMTAYRNLYYY